jgi:DNA-binding CsgD family transcriptional regulator
MSRAVFGVVVWFLCALTPMTSGAQGPSPELVLHWLANGDRTSWFEAVESARAGEWDPAALQEPLNVPFLPKSHQPDWARSVEDELMWSWMRSISERLWMQHHRPQADLGMDSVLKTKEQSSTTRWALVALGVWLCTLVFAVGWLRIRRYERAILNVTSEWYPDLATAPLAGEWSDSVRTEWTQLQRLNPSDSGASTGRWLLLSAPEKEVAQLLVQHISVRKIAKQMACSPSHIYNVRSSIRRKWNLEASENLIEVIAREREGS